MSVRACFLAAAVGCISGVGTVRAAAPAPADVHAIVGMLRAGGCGGLAPVAPAVPADPLLDRAAQLWAGGHSLAEATARTGYGTAQFNGLHLTGPRDALVGQLRSSGCGVLVSPAARGLGVYQRGDDTWLVMASASAGTAQVSPAASVPVRYAPARSVSARSVPATEGADSAVHLRDRALQLVNDARARGTRCGTRAFAPAPPLVLSATLGGVASGHASDMAVHHYFEHADRSGQSPADRVRAAGYHEKLVGENIAYGPESVEEAVAGWLASPGHCENIMDPRFAEMGIAIAPGSSKDHGLYWVQLLAEPRA